MKVFKIAAPILITTSLLVLACGCSSKEESSVATKTITTTVKRGDISLEVTGTGNLALSETEDLAFDMAGTVEEVLVSAGETVTEGQELAKLDTSVWDNQVKSLQKVLVSAQRALVSATRAVSSKELALRQAELDLQSAEDDLNDISVVKYAQESVENTENALKAAQTNYLTDPVLWGPKLESILSQLIQAKAYLTEVLRGTTMSVSSDISLQITRKVLALDQSEMQLENARIAVEDAVAAVDDAETAVEEAQNDLTEAQNLSPIITAPFAGFITRVNISGGAEVQKGTVAMQLADPDKFKANIQVTEEDIFSIELLGSATVTIDASETTYPATITAISPTATVSSGVVSYKVTVELNTSRTINTTGNFPSGMTPPSGFSGNMTMPSGMVRPDGTSGNMTPPSGFFPSSGDNTASSTNSISTPLKDGLTATVSIIVTQADNVLLVPSRALTRSGQTYTVQVVNGDTTEPRTVTTGDSDDTNTEITNGLTEGETIAYTISSSSSSSSSNSEQFPGIGGMGGMGSIGGSGGPPGGF